MRKRALLLMVFAMIMSIVSAAQHRKLNKRYTEIRLLGGKPATYITYERSGKRKPLEMGESDDGIWLRFHNNTKWTIIFPAFGVPQLYGDVGMYYTLEQISKGKVGNIPDLPKGYELGHLYSTYSLGPGKSVLFSIPSEHLPKGVMLRVRFSYEWENQDDVFADREAQHFVFFQAAKLP